ncbi:PPOX class F420-dependent oxidoreductase [Dictyobacter arantiisoli]|uniref:PPOX class F420-dependent enzyme n=1 Tax=Dictyobacter arantiisoli TaxID=2014874 RepID=A0A5A5TCC7_9CHLR|nr:PPOX class F420-dependent oxidoreductase [Dictyobacter arantiisoli]GCF09092.1 PPOX class F420-dependent enzyme [Dictyobacter arantiisoli]
MAVTTISEECRTFLSEKVHTAKLATVRVDGRPHVAPIWFVLDGDTVIFMTGRDTVKGKNLARTGQASLCVDDEYPPFSYAMIDGTVTLSEDLKEMKPWSTKLAARYMGEAEAEAFGARNAVEGELLVRLTPTNIVFLKNIAD